MAQCQFAPSMQSLAEIRHWLQAQLQDHLTADESSAVKSRVVTVTTEWVTNILRHAHESATHITVEFQRGDSRAVIRISDDSDSGDPFHDMQISILDSISPLEVGGRGMAMIMTMSDDCDYYPRSGPGGDNRLQLGFDVR